MTQLSPADLAEAFITNIQSNATIMALLSDSDEVRESSWKGTDFSYPNIRVKINSPLANFEDCYQDLNVSIYFFSEQASKRQANQAIGTISNEYHNKSMTIGSVYFSHIKTTQIPAIAESVLIWRSEVILTSLVK